MKFRISALEGVWRQWQQQITVDFSATVFSKMLLTFDSHVARVGENRMNAYGYT